MVRGEENFDWDKREKEFLKLIEETKNVNKGIVMFVLS